MQRIFDNKERLEGMLQDLFHFDSFLWAFCISVLRGVSLSVYNLISHNL